MCSVGCQRLLFLTADGAALTCHVLMLSLGHYHQDLLLLQSGR